MKQSYLSKTGLPEECMLWLLRHNAASAAAADDDDDEMIIR